MATTVRSASGGAAGLGKTERYAAFVSYSHSDEGVARWLHRGIEGYRFPKALRGEDTEFGPVPAKLPPVFRDRDELAASGDLGAELRAALAAARFQIVLCSPRAAQSKWVNEEILAFKRTHGEHRTLALIVEGEPYAGGADECFPPALRYKLAPDGTLSDEPAEPIAADNRKGKDGKRLALLKLLAGISGTRLDQLVRRDAARRQRRLAFVAAGSGLVALTTIGLAIYAESQRRVAVEQRDMAEASLAFLTGTFEIANPATENPRTITALTVLDRASKRAAKEFADKPGIAASLLRTTGEIYMGLGLLDEAERDFQTSLQFSGGSSAERAQALLKLTTISAKQRSDPIAARNWLSLSEEAMRTVENESLEAALSEGRADVLSVEAKYEEAALAYGDAARRYSKLSKVSPDNVARALSNEGRALRQAGLVDDAEVKFSAAAKIAIEAHGIEDVRSAKLLQNLALSQFDAGRFGEALAQMKTVMRIYDRVLEDNHPSKAAAWLFFGRIFSALDQHDEAMDAFGNARRIHTRLNGPDNPAVGDIDFYAAEAEATSGNFSEALVLAANTRRIYAEAYGPDDPDQAEIALLEARILFRKGDLASARSRCSNALAIQRRIGTVSADTQKFCASLSS